MMTVHFTDGNEYPTSLLFLDRMLQACIEEWFGKCGPYIVMQCDKYYVYLAARTHDYAYITLCYHTPLDLKKALALRDTLIERADSGSADLNMSLWHVITEVY